MFSLLHHVSCDSVEVGKSIRSFLYVRIPTQDIAIAKSDSYHLF